MKHALLIAAAVVSFGVLSVGCGHKAAEDTSKEWTPAKMGMTRDQFFKMAAEKAQERQGAQAHPGGSPATPASPKSGSGQ